jgi:hypothetical protein
MIICSQFRGRTLTTDTTHLVVSNQTMVQQLLDGRCLLSEVFAGTMTCQEIARLHEDAKKANGMEGP